MTIKATEYYLLDVFTDKKYGGNPLAIFPDATGIDTQLFQIIARELNLSETVFLFPAKNEEPVSMRIFTPAQELPTAGHPTVGTGYFLGKDLEHPTNGSTELILRQKVGDIKVIISYKNDEVDLVTMYQPLPVFGPTHDDRREIFAKLLGLQTDDIDKLPIQEVSCGNNILLIPLKSCEALANIDFDTAIWKQLKHTVNNAFVYIFTIHDVEGGDVKGRMFAPETGIMEDPATGSANGPLVAYLTHHQALSMPIKSLQGYEMGRPSQLYLDTEVDAKGKISAVKVAGKSVLTGKGMHFL